ncbi:sensor histidine kinase [Pseudohalioglobus sediminis]|uniref:Sensor histidine kinase n=1 Tax=Pseudohalioglobus sediminis TaxID=2606449 RepID=A0A5B0X422_9GAMM|nr:histidine kinase [Pseudohalioglobus sediminis]KAA1194074.1 sensor histidine kinase [Pseudohalioglobus sediminis]
MNMQEMLKDKRQLFWLLQLAGWSGWAMSFYLGVIMWGRPPEMYYLYLPFIATIGMLLTLVLRALYRHMWEMEITRRIVAIVAGSYAAGLVWMAVRGTVFYHFYPEQRKVTEQHGMELLSYFDGAISAFWVMLVWSALYFGIKNYMLAQEEKERGLKAVSMAHEAQLKMLRYQLNPHFLFNTLNAISTLILDRDNELANVMVTRLSRFLRYTLDNDPMQKVSVTEEMEALRLYLDIEKVRFDERLQLHFDVDEAVSDALMPSLLLQPLVENAIKYAIAQAINGGRIAVSAQQQGQRLHLQVADDGPGIELNGKSPAKSGGVGLVNCRERLKEIYGEQQSFELCRTEPHGLTIDINIPLEFGNRAS